MQNNILFFKFRLRTSHSYPTSDILQNSIYNFWFIWQNHLSPSSKFCHCSPPPCSPLSANYTLSYGYSYVVWNNFTVISKYKYSCRKLMLQYLINCAISCPSKVIEVFHTMKHNPADLLFQLHKICS